MMKLIRERCAGLSATSAVLIAGLIGVSSYIVEIGASDLAVEYGDRAFPRVQSQSDAAPVAARANPTDQRGLILYLLMEATRGRPIVSH